MANGFGSLHVGASGLRGAQNGLNVVANNIANVDTKGYVRQQVSYEDKSYNKFAGDVAISKMKAGLGVEIGDVVHTRDMFLDRDYRTQNARSAFYEANFDAITEVETLLKENGGTFGSSYVESINDLYQAFAEFKNYTGDQLAQETLVQKADLFVTRSQDVYNGLVNYQKTINKKISDDIDKINQLGSDIHKLNIQIQSIEAGGIETAMDLRDARDQALDELSQLADITYKETANGIVKVQLENTDFVIESRAYRIEMKRDEVTGFVTPYWDALSDPLHNSYYEVFNTANVSSTKNKDMGEVKGLLLARGETTATYMNMLEMNYYDENLSVEGTPQMSAEDYEKTTGNSVMMNTESELDQLVHNMVSSINELFSPTTGLADSVEMQDMTEQLKEINPSYDLKNIVLKEADGTILYSNAASFKDANGNTFTADPDDYKDFDLAGLRVFDSSKNACVGADDTLPPRELFTRIGCDRYRTVTYEFVDENGDPIKDDQGNILTGSLYVYNEEGVPRIYDTEKGLWMPDTSRCYSMASIELDQEILEHPNLIPHKYQERFGGAIAYDLGTSIYNLWEAEDCTINPTDRTKCGFTGYYAKMVGELSTVGSVYRTNCEVLTSAKLSVENNRQAVIGVSTDEELQTMIKYQNAYNASSRYINVISEMIETLINTMGA